MSRRPFRTAPVVTALACYAGATAIVAFWPTPVDRPASDLLRRALRGLHELGAPAWFDYPLVEMTANVVMFVPLGFLIAALLPRSLVWLSVVFGFSASITIELVQALALPQRYPALTDVMANTMGTAIGALALVAIELARAGRSR
jgi:VanZ family protein